MNSQLEPPSPHCNGHFKARTGGLDPQYTREMFMSSWGEPEQAACVL